MGRNPSNAILDSGYLKIIYADENMEPQHVKDFKAELATWTSLSNKMEWWTREWSLWRSDVDARKPDKAQFQADERQWSQCPEIMKVYIDWERSFPKRGIKDSKEIAEYMGITPFYPSVMINISPG